MFVPGYNCSRLYHFERQGRQKSFVRVDLTKTDCKNGVWLMVGGRGCGFEVAGASWMSRVRVSMSRAGKWFCVKLKLEECARCVTIYTLIDEEVGHALPYANGIWRMINGFFRLPFELTFFRMPLGPKKRILLTCCFLMKENAQCNEQERAFPDWLLQRHMTSSKKVFPAKNLWAGVTTRICALPYKSLWRLGFAKLYLC